jgi:hypothetical protein
MSAAGTRVTAADAGDSIPACGSFGDCPSDNDCENVIEDQRRMIRNNEGVAQLGGVVR